MGLLLSRSSDKVVLADAFIDFEAAEPKTDDEKKIYDHTLTTLEKAPALLNEVKNYSGADECIRQAIQEPSEESRATAWAKLLPMVEKLKQFHEYSQELALRLPDLITGMTANSDDIAKSIIEKESLVKLFADIVSFAFEFDAIKLKSPSMQNDFSYYKRSLQRMQMDDVDTDNLCVDHELATVLSMFYAVPNPMYTALIAGVKECPKQELAKALVTMANVCLTMVKGDTSKFREEEKTTYYVLRVMTGIIVLFDNVGDVSVFSKKSGVDVKSAIIYLQKLNVKDENPELDTMLNALHWSTPTFNSAETPKDVKKLFA